MAVQDKIDVTYELDLNVSSSSNVLNTVKYNRPDVPLYIREEKISDYPSYNTMPHWHADFELIRIISGEMSCRVNTKVIHLHEDDCIFINSQQLHFEYSISKKECTYERILVHPKIFTDIETLQADYVEPFYNDFAQSYFYYPATGKQTAAIRPMIDKIVSLENSKPKAYELSIIGFLNIIFSSIYSKLPEEAISLNFIKPITKKNADLEIQRNMVSFIQANYDKKITLNDIAASGNVSRSKCCTIFQAYLHQSPNDFLNSYRLNMSYNLLKGTTESITTIASSCGFNHLSYFSKAFYQKFKCTPRELRKENAEKA